MNEPTIVGPVTVTSIHVKPDVHANFFWVYFQPNVDIGPMVVGRTYVFPYAGTENSFELKKFPITALYVEEAIADETSSSGFSPRQGRQVGFPVEATLYESKRKCIDDLQDTETRFGQRWTYAEGAAGE